MFVTVRSSMKRMLACSSVAYFIYRFAPRWISLNTAALRKCQMKLLQLNIMPKNIGRPLYHLDKDTSDYNIIHIIKDTTS